MVDLNEFRPKILEILRGADLDSITPKEVRDQLQLGTDIQLHEYKKQLKPIIEECYDVVAKEKALEETRSDNSSVMSDPEVNPAKPTAATPKKPRKRKTSSGKDKDDDDDNKQKKSKKPKKKREYDPAKLEANNFTRTWILDDLLAEITGHKELSRPKIVKHLWEYIRKHGLQDPEKKTMIKCDEKLTALFDGETYLSSFQMQKYLGKHLLGPAVPDPKPDTTTTTSDVNKETSSSAE